MYLYNASRNVVKHTETQTQDIAAENLYRVKQNLKCEVHYK